MRRPEDGVFLALVIGVTIALSLVIQPFFGAILWGMAAALIFAPVNDRLALALGGRRGAATSLTLLMILALVVVPTILLGVFMASEIADVYARIQSGNIDLGQIFMQFQTHLPNWAVDLLERMGLADLGSIRARFATGVASSFQTLAGQAFNISQGALAFLMALGVMLYLSFFLLRDGQEIANRIEDAIPLHPPLRRALIDKITTVVRATIKGSLFVAVLQGLIGGIIFWLLGIGGALLWGVAMGFFSLLPAIGTGLIWVPVALYLFASGAIWQGAILVFCGLFVIGMVDNLVRPILVGRDTRMPDYVVFISTLGGIDLFGFNGFVIGPVIAALFMAIWEIFTELRKQG